MPVKCLLRRLAQSKATIKVDYCCYHFTTVVGLFHHWHWGLFSSQLFYAKHGTC